MAWPPVPPPNTRSNTTPRPTNLANDINLTSDAITEITDRLNDLPVFVQYGTISVPASGTIYNAADLTYPEPFGATPITVCTVAGSASRHSVETGANTSTGCQVGVWQAQGGEPFTRTVHWVAIGVRA